MRTTSKMRLIHIAAVSRRNIGDVVAVEVKRRLPRLWPWLTAIISGLLAAAAFPPFDQNWLIWLALVPLCGTILFSGEDAKRSWLCDLVLVYFDVFAFLCMCCFCVNVVYY